MRRKKTRRKPNLANPNSMTWRKKADDAWKNAPGPEECEVCKSIGAVNHDHSLNNHHLIGRTNLRYRHDLKNRVRLCATHHTLGNYKTDICAHGDTRQSEKFMIWLSLKKLDQYAWWMTHKDDKRKREETYQEAYERLTS